MWNFVAFLVLAAAGAFLIWFGRAFLLGSNAIKKLEQQIDAQGVDTDAEIVNHRISTGKTSYYFITYQYTATLADGQTQKLTGEDAVNPGDYNRLKLGDHITVRYLPDNPKSVKPGSGIRRMFSGATMRLNGMILVVIGAALVISGAVICAGFTISDSNRAAEATAQTLLLSATPNESQKRATVYAGTVVALNATSTTEADEGNLGKIQDALASRLAEWKHVDDRVMHRVLPPETGLGLGEVEIDYGRCPRGGFYVYIWTRITDRLNLGYELDTFLEGYGYVTDSTPPDCNPKELAQVWLRKENSSLGNDWYAVQGAIVVKIEKK